MKISDFLRVSCGSMFVGKNIPTNLLGQLVNENMQASPGTIEFVGILKKEFNLWNEYSILYRFPKTSIDLGSNIKALGNTISRLPLGKYSFGIQEIDPSQSDGYYILFYALEEINTPQDPRP